VGWCLAGVLLALLQPFLFSHFRQDGWEDEGKFGVRDVSAVAQFEPDERSDHPNELETTLYVPAAAHIDAPEAFQQGLDVLMALVWLTLPLTVALMRLWVPPDRVSRERVPHTSGAPPSAVPWRSQPPKTAPPLST
jgi:hypothetical protein